MFKNRSQVRDRDFRIRVSEEVEYLLELEAERQATHKATLASYLVAKGLEELEQDKDFTMPRYSLKPAS